MTGSKGKEIISNNEFITTNYVRNNKDYNILIVDDIPSNIQRLGKILRTKNYGVSFAYDGLEALKLIKNNHFDLILLDISMPKMDGFELCEIIKKDPATCNICVIFITAAKNEPGDIVHGFNIGGQDYINKPFCTEELLARVQTHLELADKTKQLSNLNKQLEAKVIERTRELRKEKEKTEQLGEAKNAFLKIIRHKLGNPLQTILCTCENIETVDTPIQKKIHSYLNTSYKELKEISDLAYMISSRLASREELKFQTEYINLLIEKVITKMTPKANDKFQTINHSKEIDLVGHIDCSLIELCIEYILDNAINHGPENSTIQINSTKRNNIIIISISDKGDGFKKDILNFINQPFNTSKKNNEAGLGLSIFIVQKIIGLHDGNFEINHENKKTTVSISFPCS
ncbi:MAG: response regulator [Bacteroidales bacterium]